MYLECRHFIISIYIWYSLRHGDIHYYEAMYDFQKYLQKLYEMPKCSYAKLWNKKFKEAKLKVFVPLLRGCKTNKILVASDEGLQLGS